MSLVNPLSNYLRKRRGKLLANQIERLHPELSQYSGEEKVNRYALLAFRFFPAQRDPVLGEKPIFNELVADAHPDLLEKVLAYLSVEPPAYYYGEMIKVTIQNQDLRQLVKEQNLLIETLKQSQEIHTKAIRAIDKQAEQVRQAIDPETRLN